MIKLKGIQIPKLLAKNQQISVGNPFSAVCCLFQVQFQSHQKYSHQTSHILHRCCHHHNLHSNLHQNGPFPLSSFSSRISSSSRSHLISSSQLLCRHNMTGSGNDILDNQQSQQQQTNTQRLVQTLAKEAPDSFKSADVSIKTLKPEERAPKPAWDKLVFGSHCNDHMLKINWTKQNGWAKPEICPLQNLSLHPYAKVFHYALELFEGLKAYRGPDGKVRLFRPDLNMARMRNSAERLCLPDFDSDELIDLIKKLLQIDQDWVPPFESHSSLYIRPTLMGTEPTLGVSPSNEAMLFVVAGPVGPYFSTGFKPVSLFADSRYIRAWPGGSGNRKIGSNYGPTLTIQREALRNGQQQVLWLYGPDHQLTEVGTMNIFAFIKRLDGKLELCTPPIESGIILPGVTRFSLLELARSWKEFKVVERVITMEEVQKLVAENRMIEMFGSGTACVVCPVGEINFEGTIIKLPSPSISMRFNKELADIQYGVTKHPWSVMID